MKRSLRSWLWRVPLEQEVDEEIALHIELKVRELTSQGMDPSQARETVLARFGDMERVKRTCMELGRKRDREMGLRQRFEELGTDIGFAIRQLKASPGFAFIAAMTLALGIGANSAMFALADATLLRPLPFRDPDRLVLIGERARQQLRSNIAQANVEDWVGRNRTFDGMAAWWYSPGDGGPTLLARDGTPETVIAQQVTAGFFDLLGVPAIAGRTFVAGDETTTFSAVVLGETFWRNRFGADPALIGREITLSGQPMTVVGVVPASFHFFRDSSVWTLLPRPDAAGGRRPRFNLQVIGRLKAGVTPQAAHADLTPIADALATQYADTRRGRSLSIQPLRDVFIGSELRLTSLLFLGVVGFVLLMCCANVANLLLARATARTRELALRSALGAARGRIVVQLLTESLVLAMLGGTLGLAVGAAILAVAPSVIPPDLLPGSITLALDARVMTFCGLTSLLVGVLFGLAPAWQATGISLVQALTSSTRTSTGHGGRFRHVLVVTEIATAVLLLCGGGLLLRTLLTLETLDPGYQAGAASVLTMDVTLPGSRYPTPESLLRFFDSVQAEVMAAPGVRSAGWATMLPLGGSQIGQNPFQIVGDAPAAPDSRPAADYQIVSPSYFETLRIPIIAGRAFTGRDTAGSAPVCIVNEAFVRRHLNGRNPIGVRMTISGLGVARGGNTVEREIVGVAHQVRGKADEPQDLAQIYIPNAQFPYAEAFLAVSPKEGRAEALASAVRAAVARVDTLQPIRRMVTLEQVADEATARYRFRAVMVVTFAGLALVLSMVGVFGVLAYSVQQRTREFGVRIALGATSTQILGLVIGSAARLICAGVGIGLGAAVVFAQTVSTFLFGVPARDLWTFGAVGIVLAITGALACAGPAIRAAHVDPAVTFRSE